MKTCTKCGGDGPFGIQRSAPDGHTYWCRPCLNAKSKECRLKKIDHYRAVNNATTKKRYRLLRDLPPQDDTIVEEYDEPIDDYANSRSRWTMVDNDYLAATWGVLTDEEIVQTLGRTIRAIEKQAWLLNLNKLDQWRTPAKFAKVLHVDPKLVRLWIAKGRLKAVKTHVRNAWHIPDEAVTEFLRKEPYYAMVAQREHEKARLQQQYREREAA